MFEQRKLRAILKGLESSEKSDRVAAYDRLKQLVKSGISDEGGQFLIQAAAQEWPDRGKFDDPCADTLRSFFTNMRPIFVPLIVELFPRFTPGGREIALNLLARQKEAYSLRGFIDLLEKHSRHGLIQDVPTYVMKLDTPEAAGILFPALFQFLEVPGLRLDVAQLAFQALGRGLLTREAIAPFSSNFLSYLDELHERLAPLQEASGTRWMWTDNYRKDRSGAALLLDLAGFLEARAASQALEGWLSFSDPLLLMYAALSLLLLGQPVDPMILERCAAFAETRNLLFDNLTSLGKGELFPAKFRKQRYFAESDMVRWLSFGTELDTVPDEIELMKVIESKDDDEAWMDYYLFRFRTFEPHWSAEDGWQAGVAGPFKRSERPSTGHHGATFSCFESWDSKAPMEHFEEIVGVTRKYWERKTEDENE